MRMAIITFLGTAGGRFATILQERATGGIYIQDCINIHLDPGPGALLKAKEFGIDALKTDAILVSHCHPDHYNDAEILIEAMTTGGLNKKGYLIGSESVVNGVANYDCCLSNYHKSKVAKLVAMKSGDEILIGNLKILATSSFHSDPSAIGFKFFTKNGIISYISDTSLNEEVIKQHKNARLLIISLMRPLNLRIPFHLSTEDALEIVKEIAPELAILTHFGMRIIKDIPDKDAEYIYKNSQIKTISAKDGMKVKMEKEIEIF